MGLVVASVLSLAYQRATRERSQPRPVLNGAAAVVERFECYRCHDAPGKLEPAAREKHCVHCHQALHAGAFDGKYHAADVARWKQNNVHLTAVPSLAGLDVRLRRSWLIAFLQRPHDLRPNLAASMPRLPIGPEEARAIADHFIPSPDAPGEEPPGEPGAGRALYASSGCPTCHAFGGTGLTGPPPNPNPEVRLAPDLRHTRARMTAAALDAWLTDPAALKPDTLMPRPALSDAQRRDLVAFLLRAPLASEPVAQPPARPPPLARRVTYQEVETRVFKHVCWHCHSDPTPVRGDGGPGNTGGFGYRGVRLDLSFREAALRGGVGHDGRPLDLRAPDAHGVPLVVASLLARHAEDAGQPADLLGMPLGLPPVPLEDIRLVDAWIAQGCPD